MIWASGPPPTLWLEKTTLISMIWARCRQRAPLWNGPLTRENYTHKYDLTSVHAAGTPVNWPKDSQKHDLDPLADKKWFLKSQVGYAVVKTTLKSIKWPVYMDHVHLWIGQKTHKNTISILLQIKSDSSQVKLAMQLGKLRSKVSNDQCLWIDQRIISQK